MRLEVRGVHQTSARWIISLCRLRIRETSSAWQRDVERGAAGEMVSVVEPSRRSVRNRSSSRKIVKEQKEELCRRRIIVACEYRDRS
jgi:hypothetical protein